MFGMILIIPQKNVEISESTGWMIVGALVLVNIFNFYMLYRDRKNSKPKPYTRKRKRKSTYKYPPRF